MSEAQIFLDQNELAAKDLTVEQVEPWAEHHAGGMRVLMGYTATGRCVKMHDSWGDDGMVVVHAYDPNLDEDPDEIEAYFQTGREAFWFFSEVAR